MGISIARIVRLHSSLPPPGMSLGHKSPTLILILCRRLYYYRALTGDPSIFACLPACLSACLLYIQIRTTTAAAALGVILLPIYRPHPKPINITNFLPANHTREFPFKSIRRPTSFLFFSTSPFL